MAQKSKSVVDEDTLNKFELELKQLQYDLEDSLHSNDVFAGKFEQRERELVKKEHSLVVIKDKIAAELSQLELELSTTLEKNSYDLNIYQNELQRMQYEKDRFLNMAEETESLRQSVENLTEQVNRERMDFSVSMHDINKDMRLMRQNMESKFRRELNIMDMSYQREAFGALPESSKKSMFENAKLKDEVALQGIGIANLGTRLSKQNYLYDNCQKDLKKLNKKSTSLREKLSYVTENKNKLMKEREDELLEENKLINQRNSLYEEWESNPVLEELEYERDRLIRSIKSEKSLLTLWQRRLTMLQNLHNEMRPITEEEKNGHFKELSFPLDEETLQSLPSSQRKTVTSPSISRSNTEVDIKTLPNKNISINSINLNKKSKIHKLGIRPSDVEYLISKDKELEKALSILKGKESYLVISSEDGDDDDVTNTGKKDQNMVAWVVVNLIKIWRSTRLDSNINNSTLNNTNNNNFINKIDEMEDDKPLSEDQIENMWDTLLTTNNSDNNNNNLPVTQWIKAVNPPRKVPIPDMHFTTSIPLEKKEYLDKFFLTSLSTPLSTFEIGPALINDNDVFNEDMKQTKNSMSKTNLSKSTDRINTAKSAYNNNNYSNNNNYNNNNNNNNNTTDKVKTLDTVDPLLVKSLPVLKPANSSNNMINLSGNRLLLKPVHNIKASAITTYKKLSNQGRLYKSTTALEPIKNNFWEENV